MSNKRNTVVYTGVTNELAPRVDEHKRKVDPKSFTARYNCDKLVYFEGFDEIKDAIAREKQIKAGSRNKKDELVNSINPKWRDLYADVLKW